MSTILLSPYFWYSEVIIEAVDKSVKIFIWLLEVQRLLIGIRHTKSFGSQFLYELGQNVEMNQLSDPRSVTALNFDRLKKDLHHISIKILVDIESTLCGNEGMVRIYGPQKGAHSFELQIFKDLI